jgi:hypothetical protein
MLQLDFKTFTWQHPAGRKKGFAWEGEGESRPLVRVAGVPVVDYQPPDGLFRTFIDLDGSPDGILKFACRYGQLGRPTDLLDFLDSWRRYIGEMRKLVQLADDLGGNDVSAIRSAVGPVAPEELQIIAERRQTPDVRVRAAGLTDSEYVSVAARRLGVALLLPGGLPSTLDLVGEWDRRAGQAQIRLEHENLAGYMRYQLAVALVEGQQFRKCECCGRWFRLAPGINRADRVTCTPSCRFGVYRRRRRRAVDLHGQGWPVRKIAAEVRSTVAMVKKWVGAQRKEG